MSGEDSSGDSTDVFSFKFDPLKAFYKDGVHVPDAEAPIFDNISKFESFCFKGITAKTTERDAQKGVGKRSAPSSTPQDFTRSTTGAGKKSNYSKKNVVNRMEKCSGPLSALYDYMENKIKVKVHTRSISGIRGHVEAYVVAFDTHWNLALEDCVEVWTRKISRKTPAIGQADRKITETNTGCTTNVKKKNKRMEILERHISQLLLRGEQIVSIVKVE